MMLGTLYSGNTPVFYLREDNVKWLTDIRHCRIDSHGVSVSTTERDEACPETVNRTPMPSSPQISSHEGNGYKGSYTLLMMRALTSLRAAASGETIGW